ncbi:MAG: hypothetical protein PHE24_00175 [Patescibacteria group bacterium]|nr:hypothetical protein [Patescibacteria group bacterium]
MSAKRSLDWADLGKLMSNVISLFSLIRETFSQMKIGLEIIPWLMGEGKESFIKFLQTLGDEYIAIQPLVRKINDTTLIVNLGLTPKPVKEGYGIESHSGRGLAVLEKRPDGLYLDGRKVIFFRSDRQQIGKTIKGFEIRKELANKSVLNANILDALVEFPEFITEEFKNEAWIFFWGTIYCKTGGNLYVRCFHWAGSRREWSYSFVACALNANCLAAITT